MKSIFLLCEFGIPYNTILQLYDANITIENILNNSNILDNILGNGEKKYLILKIIDRAYLYPDDHSVYELIEFGLSKSIVESLINKKIRLKDIKQNIQEKYKIGQATYKKIEDSLQTYLETKNIKIEIDISNLFSLIYNEFQNNSFNINDLKELMSRKNYNFDSITENKLQELIDEKRIQKKGCLYNVSYTIDVLSKYGLSDKLLKYLKENKIELSDISDEEFILNFHVTPSKYTKILTSFNTFINNTNYCIELTKNRMINIIKNEFGNELFSLEQLYFLLENKKVSLEKVNDFLDNLISSNSIVKMNGLFKVVFPTLEHEIEKIDNKNNHRDIVLKKLSGLTLEQIGNDYGVTRERIRQIITKEFNKIPVVQEDENKYLFTKYNFDVTTFTKMFNQSEMVYYYLKEKYKSGDTEISELLNDESITEKQRQVIIEKYNLIKLYDEYIIPSKNNILTAILKKIEKQVDFNELRTIYNNIIDEYSLDLVPIEEEEFRNVDSVLGRNDFVLNTRGRVYRYYNCKDIDEENIKELGNLLDIDPGVYSAELFFNDNPLLMKKLDILDEYELHNLFRKVLEPNDDIIYSRMPDIYIKCNDKYQFVESLIQEYSPVSIDEFTEFVYQSYGHKIPTFRAYLQSNFNHYINLNMLISNCPKFDSKQYEFMKEFLKEDIYSTITIKQLLTDEFDVKDFKLLNNLNFSTLGYKLRGNYIMKSSISNLENYMRNLISNIDFYEIPAEMKKIGSTFSSYLYKFIYDKRLFKYDENTYITVKKLETMGICEDDIDDFIKKISNIIPDNEYFNLFVLNTDFESKLFDLKLPDCFYETLITIIPNVKTFTLKNNTIFIKTNETATREKFINSFITKNKTYISEIKKQINEIFNIDLQEYYIRDFVNRNKYYLQNGTDCIYLSKDIYEKEVNQWDILQYID